MITVSRFYATTKIYLLSLVNSKNVIFKTRCYHSFLLKHRLKGSRTVTVIQLKICTNKGNGTITIKRAQRRKRLGVQNLHANEVRLFLRVPLRFGIWFNNYEIIKQTFPTSHFRI